MILSDRDIRTAIEAGRITIDPFDERCIQPSSVDLHVDSQFRVFANSRYPFIDVREEQPDLTELVEVKPDEPFILHPGEFVLGSTLERVVLPDSSITTDYMLAKATSLIDGLVVYPERMLENLNATRGLIFSGQLLLALTQSGVARETAYEWVQRNAMKSWDEGVDFKALVAADADIARQLPAGQIDSVFSLESYLRNVDQVFARVFGNKSSRGVSVASGSSDQT